MDVDGLQVTIIGAGVVGTNLGIALTTAGHGVTYAARDPDSPKVAAALEQVRGAHAVPLAAAGNGAHLVVLAVPFDAVTDVLAAVGDLSGIVLVDATNAVGASLPTGCATVVDVIHSTRPDAVVVKAFNTVGAELLLDPSIDGRPLFLPVAGPPGPAEQVVALARAIGFDSAVIGGIDQVQLLEDFARLWIHLALRAGMGRHFGFARLSR